LIQPWLSPHGAIKGAQEMGGQTASRTIDGRKMTVLTFGRPGMFKVEAHINGANMVERVLGWTADAVLGETRIDVRYTDYRTFDGIKFPTAIRAIQNGHPMLDVGVDDVRTNVPAEITVPEAVKKAQERVVSVNAADGVWHLTGGTYHSAVIAMKSYTIVVEAPLYDGRAAAVLAEARKLVPGKPVRYAIVTHDHFGHAGGARYFAAQGITVIAHDDARDFFERSFARPASYYPDALARAGVAAKLDGVAAKRVFSENGRTVEIYHVRGNPHSAAMLMVYLPKEKILIEADAFTPGAPNAPYPAAINPATQNLYDNIERLGLAVENILPIHGRMVPFDELKRALGKAG
jgi:glyoxylase-like metal-dependent hydrolase (beta-lactamase superfamily II)